MLWPQLLVANTCQLSSEDQVLLLISAIATLIQLFPIGCIIASGLPVIIYGVNAVQTIGHRSSTTSGRFDRMLTNKELAGDIVDNGVASVIGALVAKRYLYNMEGIF